LERGSPLNPLLLRSARNDGGLATAQPSQKKKHKERDIKIIELNKPFNINDCYSFPSGRQIERFFNFQTVGWALTISLFPGGPGIFSIVKPAACIALLTSDLLQ
jgi:hypothetical protein